MLENPQLILALFGVSRTWQHTVFILGIISVWGECDLCSILVTYNLTLCRGKFTGCVKPY